MLLLALLVAAILRFWQLDQVPPGLYRDEAFNGLDALKVLGGEHALYFPANNGREPLYIYLTAAAVAIWGRTTFALRASAALVGTLTTIPVYLLARSWFGRRTGVLAAWIWAITLWPVHLSRIGLRTILVVPVMTVTFWLVTMAYRRQKPWLWGSAGFVYGLGFYTYLAMRFTPLLLLFSVLFLILAGRGRRLWPGVLWFLAGLSLVLLPLAYQSWSQPGLLFGRSGQVSILNPTVNDGSILSALGRNIWATAGMFFWSGDTILRHNPAGRPVFDLLMVLPFITGLVWCLLNWRRPAATALLLWFFIMLGPTVLAADAPHFLRAVGTLPAAILLPSIGLDRIWQWSRLPSKVGALLVSGLVLGTLLWTTGDYLAYARDPEVALVFEAAATKLAEQIKAEPAETDVLLDERFWSGWPSLSYLIPAEGRLYRYSSAGDFPEKIQVPTAIYAWPYEPLDFVPESLALPVQVSIEDGQLARGDLEEIAYPLYVRFGVEPSSANQERLAAFADELYLYETNVTELSPNTIQVDIYWGADGPVDEDLSVFVHVSGPEQLIGQDDRPPASGRWREDWWRPGLLIHDAHQIELSEPYDGERHQISIGLYRSISGERVPVSDRTGGDRGTAWILKGE